MKKEIIKLSRKDEITYDLISEIVYKFFTYEGKSILKGADYRISKNERVWFINFAPLKKINQIIKEEKYAIYPSPDLNNIFFFNATGTKKLIEDRLEKFKSNNDNIIVFAKFKDNFKYEGYKFLGIYKFENTIDNDISNLLFKKIEDDYVVKKGK
ncbi:hypothetical protein [Spiroplasma floricola]|uniref:PvuRts1 I-like SET and RING associated domain-containing protein n=1 Tax=Spiroplasma floricola 23-6 TaxID=1336749 RepID=A0A2K8SFZ6_9MOLU|nr:hypothetical protein [Spiroplasma floricola]AUB32178.1 hypothetical protein SFLOR_v1c11320 [Spiroplasma floricola 23-6]